jgi:hypothetical protein
MITIGIFLAILLSKTGILDLVINNFINHYVLASFVAGVFFTSAFTIAPASVALVHIAEYAPLNWIAVWGALGAVCGAYSAMSTKATEAGAIVNAEVKNTPATKLANT